MIPNAERPASSPAAPRVAPFLALALLTLTASGCELVEGIFKVGLWAGIILVVLVVALVAWGARAVSRRSGPR